MLTLRSITAFDGETTVWRGGDLTAGEREVVALLGPNRPVVVEECPQKALELATTVDIFNRDKMVHVGPASELDTHEFYERSLGIETSGTHG